MIFKDQPTLKNKQPLSGWPLLTKAQIEELARYGWAGKKNDFDSWDHLCETPFDDIDKEEFRLINVNQNCDMLFDEKNLALPVGSFVDYILWHMDNTVYNLRLAHKHLKTHPHVYDLSDVEEILYYNQGEKRKKCISFIWSPDVETYRKAWETCLEMDTKYPSTKFPKAVFHLDLLGLRKIGAAKSEDFYGGL